MSASYRIKASIGSQVIAEDILFTASHPGITTVNSGWTKTPMYAPLSAVPLKGAIVDQFRKAAATGSGVSLVAEVDALIDKREKLNKSIENIDLSRELKIIKQVEDDAQQQEQNE